jgi:cellulose biosynthesis protein BcsQ
MRTIAPYEPEGWMRKTITSINLAAFLACAQRRGLLADMDPQGRALGPLADHAFTPSCRWIRPSSLCMGSASC